MGSSTFHFPPDDSFCQPTLPVQVKLLLFWEKRRR
uniref:Uncharacterized protein n=1 Tax=Setaria italica TaxID=4555 RepID=K3Z1G0_SETIT